MHQRAHLIKEILPWLKHARFDFFDGDGTPAKGARRSSRSQVSTVKDMKLVLAAGGEGHTEVRTVIILAHGIACLLDILFQE